MVSPEFALGEVFSGFLACRRVASTMKDIGVAHRAHCLALATLGVWQTGHSIVPGVIAGSGPETRTTAFPTALTFGTPRFYTTQPRIHATNSARDHNFVAGLNNNCSTRAAHADSQLSAGLYGAPTSGFQHEISGSTLPEIAPGKLKILVLQNVLHQEIPAAYLRTGSLKKARLSPVPKSGDRREMSQVLSICI